MASLHKSSLGHHHHPLSCNPGFRFDQFYLLLTVFFCSDVSSRTRSRSRQADSSTNMSLPDPRPVVAPRRRRQPARQPGPAPPPPQPDLVACIPVIIFAVHKSDCDKPILTCYNPPRGLLAEQCPCLTVSCLSADILSLNRTDKESIYN